MAFYTGEAIMNLHLAVAPVVALIAGILILAMPQLLNLIVAIYLIVIGVTGLLNRGIFSSKVT
jgi:hypothetical protein